MCICLIIQADAYSIIERKRGNKLCFYIGIEDLAANVLIEILQSKNGDDSQNIVTYAELEKYGAEVVHYLGEQGEKAVLILSRENTNYMLCSYSDFFVETEMDKKEPAIELRKGKTVSDLIERFRTYLEIDVLLAFMSEKTVSVLIRQSFRD